MQTLFILAGTTPIGLTALLVAASDVQTGSPNYLEYGAFGLCTFLVGWLCKYVYDLKQEAKELQNFLLHLTEQNTKAFERWAALLAERPCLVGDKKQIQGE